MSISTHLSLIHILSPARRFLSFKTTVLTSGLVLIFFCSVSFSLEGNDKNQEVVDFRMKIHRLQKGIDNQENKIQNTDKQERNLLLELEVLDKKLADQQARLNNFEVQMDRQRALIEEKITILTTFRSKKKNVEHHLVRRIKAYYTTGGIGLLNVTFSTKNLPELLQFHDSFDTLLKYDQNVIVAYKTTIQEVERAKTALTLEKSILQNFIDLVLTEKKEAIATIEQKENLLTHIRTQGKLHKQAIKEMQQASNTLANALATIKSKSDVQNNGFLAGKGLFPPPLEGVIVTFFNEEKINKLGILRKSSGITLRAIDGVNIKAIHKGDVVFSGYLRGYGNTVIIHHGYQYYTVTSRIEKLLVHREDTVESGDVLGIVGDTATLFDDGLYFEIRHGKQSLNPLLWLDPDRLPTAEENSTQ